MKNRIEHHCRDSMDGHLPNGRNHRSSSPGCVSSETGVSPWEIKVGIGFKIKKLIRTAQSEMAFLKEAKDSLYLHGRRLLRRPHEKDFLALAAIPDKLSGCYVDVGGNQGQSIESIKLVKPNASVISFEA